MKEKLEEEYEEERKEGNESKNKRNWKKVIGWSVFWTFCISCLGITTLAIWAITSGQGIPLLMEEPKKATTAANTKTVDKEQVQKAAEGLAVEKEFISQHHDVLNDLVGWGAIASPNWESAQNEASEIEEKIDRLEVNDPILKKDFDEIKRLAEIVSKEKETAALRDLHRYVHDLDVIANGDYGSGDYYYVTAYGEANLH